jgi:hypothetical protein
VPYGFEAMRILRHFLLALMLLATQQAGLLHFHADVGESAGHALAAGGDETPDESGTAVCADCVAFAGTVPAPPAILQVFPGGALRQVHALAAVSPAPTFAFPAAYRSRAPPALPI